MTDTTMRAFPAGAPALLTLAITLGLWLADDALASCGAENCPLDNTTLGGRARRLSIELSYQYVDQNDARTGTVPTDVNQAYDNGGEVRTTSNTTTMKALFSLSPRFLVTGSIPYVHRFHSHVTAGDLPIPELREWTYSGPGDLTLTSAITLWGESEQSSSFNLIAGVKLPTGRDHVPAIDGEEPEPHARPGTGSTDLIAGFQILTRVTLGGMEAPTLMFASSQVTRTGVGVDDYKMGNMLEGHLGASIPFRDRLRAQLQMNAQVREKDRSLSTDAAGGHAEHAIPGEGASTEETGVHENTGGTAVFAAPGLRYDVTPWIALSSYVQLPVYQKVNGTQLVAPLQFWIGTTYKFQ